MEFLSSVLEKVIDVTSTVIVAVLIHIPFLMNILMGIPLTPAIVKAPVHTYASPKITELEKAVNSKNTNDSVASLDETKNWGLCDPTSPVTQISKTGSDHEHTKLGFEKVDDKWNRLFVPFDGYKVIRGYCMKYPNNWKIALAGAESLAIAFNRGNDSTTTPEFFFQAVGSSLALEDSDKVVYRYEDSSSPLVESNEVVISKQTKKIGNKEALILITKEGDIFYFRIFIKNEDTLYVLSKSFSSNEYGAPIYADFLTTAYEMISSLRPLGS